MKILAIDTATEACSAALLIDGRFVARELEFERGHAEHILPMVDEVLVESGLQLAALDAIAFGRGPGGFTGVRLAASVAQGLAFGAGRPVVPISDLAAVAQRALDLNAGAGRVLVCNDARMQEVYWGCFECGPDGLAVSVGTEHVTPPGKVVLPPTWPGATTGDPKVPHPPASIVAAGRGFRAYPALRTRFEPLAGAVHDMLLPGAREIARLAAVEVLAGRLLSAEEAIPVYLRDNVARPPSRN